MLDKACFPVFFILKGLETSCLYPPYYWHISVQKHSWATERCDPQACGEEKLFVGMKKCEIARMQTAALVIGFIYKITSINMKHDTYSHKAKTQDIDFGLYLLFYALNSMLQSGRRRNDLFWIPGDSVAPPVCALQRTWQWAGRDGSQRGFSATQGLSAMRPTSRVDITNLPHTFVRVGASASQHSPCW